MSYQSGCNGRVLLGGLPDGARERLARLPGEWLEYDPGTGAIEIRHVQPSTAPVLPTVTVELVRILSEIPFELHSAIEGGDFFVHTEEPATQLVRLRVEKGGGLSVRWARPDYSGAARRAYTDGHEIAVPSWEQRLDGTVGFDAEDPEGAAEKLRELAGSFEGLYPEGEFRVEADADAGRITVDMREVNLDAARLIEVLERVSRPRTLEGRFDVASFAEFVPEHLLRIVFEKGKTWVQHPLLWR